MVQRQEMHTDLTTCDQKTVTLYGVVTLSAAADTYTTGGMTLSFAGMDDVKSSSSPVEVQVWSNPTAASPNTTQYVYQYNVGTTAATGKMQIFQGAASGAPFGEYGSGAALTNPFADVIAYRAVFLKV